jgi:hypothetical protein
MERVLQDPAVMGAAQKPTAWMPDKRSILTSVVDAERRVRESVEDALSQGRLQQDMGTSFRC